MLKSNGKLCDLCLLMYPLQMCPFFKGVFFVPLFCCKKFPISQFDLWLLGDIKGFTARKLLHGICPICKRSVVTLIQKRTSDGKIFKTENIKGLSAIKTNYRERKRLKLKFANINNTNMFGYVYGENKEIRNKKNEVTQIRQYRCDFKSNSKNLCKVIKHINS